MAENNVNEDRTPDQLAVSKSDANPPAFLETSEGRRLAYHKLEGSSPGVVYIHGLASDMTGKKAHALEQFCSSQGQAYVRFDLSGHGQSSESFTSCSITMWLEDLNSIMDSLTEGLQVLVGSSIGAWLMFLYTLRNPEKVHGLIGVSAAPDFTQFLWKGLDKDTRRQVGRTGVYHLQSPYSPVPYEISMGLIQDGEKYSILDMPGEGWNTTLIIYLSGDIGKHQDNLACQRRILGN